MSTTYEGQISGGPGRYQLTVTLASKGSQWTSRPAPLGAVTEEEAQAEARRKMAALRAALEPEAGER